MEREEIQQTKMSDVADAAKSPVVFDYLNFREFLADFYATRKKSHRGYSFGQFALKAKLQTRNYLKRIIEGERPLSTDYLPGFCQALELSPKEALYFENLVHFNQAKGQVAKQHYFEQLKASTPKKGNSVMELLEDQLDILSEWYYFPILELSEVMSLDASPRVLAAKLKNRVTPQQVKEAIQKLLKLGLIERDPTTQKLKKTNKEVEYVKGVRNLMVQKYHKAMMTLAMDMTENEDVDQRYLRGQTLAIPQADWPRVTAQLEAFYRDLIEKYLNSSSSREDVIQINAQILKLTQEKK